MRWSLCTNPENAAVHVQSSRCKVISFSVLDRILREQIIRPQSLEKMSSIPRAMATSGLHWLFHVIAGVPNLTADEWGIRIEYGALSDIFSCKMLELHCLGAWRVAILISPTMFPKPNDPFPLNLSRIDTGHPPRASRFGGIS